MSKVAIVTDTSHCLPAELVRKYGIKVVPLTLTIDGKSYRDMVDITPAEFWEKVKTAKQFSTSNPFLEEFVRAFQEAAQQTDSIACATVSKAMSGTYNVALIAAKMVTEGNSRLNIEIIDSKTASGGLGLLVLEAARAADAGKSLAEVVHVMQDMVAKVGWVTGLQTRQTQKWGRIPNEVFNGQTPQLIAMISSLHGTGKVVDEGKVIGKEASIQKIVELIGKYGGLTRPLHVIVQYTDNIEDGEKLFEMLQAKYNCVEIYLTSYSAVLCATTGPCLSVAFY